MLEAPLGCRQQTGQRTRDYATINNRYRTILTKADPIRTRPSVLLHAPCEIIVVRGIAPSCVDCTCSGAKHAPLRRLSWLAQACSGLLRSAYIRPLQGELRLLTHCSRYIPVLLRSGNGNGLCMRSFFTHLFPAVCYSVYWRCWRCWR
jgi:hypothetical protein